MPLLVPAALLASGAAVDAARGPGLGWLFAAAAALAAALAALTAPRGRAWWAAALPPLVIAAVAAVTQLLTGASGPHTGTTAMTAGIRWAMDSFPAIAAAEAAAVLVLTLRAVRTGRSARPDGSVRPGGSRRADGSRRAGRRRRGRAAHA
ncbi:hypothetical protein CK936_10440 [Streptomyces albireticuli]|uniref:DUF6542 domain-containing protein n=1 Tax=Streptomyces albireticuli TaxID=1940 RepID=A0A2A2D920_9ACTN|nr:hypothetical protein CK936_10440 [Streptomyces albireticuli]